MSVHTCSRRCAQSTTASIPRACSPASTTKQQRIGTSVSSHVQPPGLRECERRSTYWAASRCAPPPSDKRGMIRRRRPGSGSCAPVGVSPLVNTALRGGTRNCRAQSAEIVNFYLAKPNHAARLKRNPIRVDAFHHLQRIGF